GHSALRRSAGQRCGRATRRPAARRNGRTSRNATLHRLHAEPGRSQLGDHFLSSQLHPGLDALLDLLAQRLLLGALLLRLLLLVEIVVARDNGLAVETDGL